MIVHEEDSDKQLDSAQRSPTGGHHRVLLLVVTKCILLISSQLTALKKTLKHHGVSITAPLALVRWTGGSPAVRGAVGPCGGGLVRPLDASGGLGRYE